MVWSEMSSREKTIITVLGAIIVLALIAIGILVARLLTGGVGGGAGGIAPGTPTAEVAAAPTVTLVPAPSLEGEAPLPSTSGQAPVVQASSPAPGLAALVIAQPLVPGRRYRLVITTADGSVVPIWGSWSQAAMGTGKIQTPPVQAIDGPTPYTASVVSPLPGATSWRLSVSAAPKNLLGTPPVLVIQILDVTGAP